MYLTTSSNRYSFSNWVYDVTLRLTHVTIIQRMASLHHIHANFYTTLGIFLVLATLPKSILHTMVHSMIQSRIRIGEDSVLWHTYLTKHLAHNHLKHRRATDNE